MLRSRSQSHDLARCAFASRGRSARRVAGRSRICRRRRRGMRAQVGLLLRLARHVGLAAAARLGRRRVDARATGVVGQEEAPSPSGDGQVAAVGQRAERTGRWRRTSGSRRRCPGSHLRALLVDGPVGRERRVGRPCRSATGTMTLIEQLDSARCCSLSGTLPRLKLRQRRHRRAQVADEAAAARAGRPARAAGATSGQRRVERGLRRAHAPGRASAMKPAHGGNAPLSVAQRRQPCAQRARQLADRRPTARAASRREARRRCGRSSSISALQRGRVAVERRARPLPRVAR